VRLAINVIEDITELKRSEEAQRFLAEASRRFSGSSLDYERTLAAVGELAIPWLADRCEVCLVEDELGPEAAEVVRTGAAWLEPSRIIVPMTAGRVIGTVALEADGREFDAQDVLVAEDFGLRAGAAVENARLYRAASRIARTLQTSLLPPGLPDVPGAALAAAFHPAGQGLEVGGDFYDVFATGEGQWYLVIGDVAGKGAEAAAVTALARFSLRTAAARRRSPAAILGWVNEAMVDQDAAGGRYCTIACAHVDLTRSPARLTVACGGHPLPVLRRADGTVEQLGAYGTLLGLDKDAMLHDRSTDLLVGDTLVLYTDGLTEAQAPRAMWDFSELEAAVRRAPVDGPLGLVESLVASALGERARQRDDLALLALKLVG
jgi:serine phosphatase RsbU (regulator of sigma subunit)